MIIGATTMAQLQEDLAATQRELAPDVLADIAKLQSRYPNPAG
jgi:aryl-alcohol dehydrogenase-like predicted oxidoreductase